jgi:hypothetical protein
MERVFDLALRTLFPLASSLDDGVLLIEPG